MHRHALLDPRCIGRFMKQAVEMARGDRPADDLAALLAALKSLGLDATTDVIVTADHGFATISKESATSFAATQSYKVGGRRERRLRPRLSAGRRQGTRP
jgi:hypothetical protein